MPAKQEATRLGRTLMAGNRREKMTRFLFVIVGSERAKVRLMACSGGKQLWELVNFGFVIVGLKRMLRFSKLPGRVVLPGG